MPGLMLSLFMAAMDATIVGTALPTIARELGSFALYPWIIAGYLVTATVTAPVWGRLADVRGRRSVLLTGIAIFIVASALCAASPAMQWLIAFRTLQGIGAGCIQPLVFTILGDTFPLEQRARLQGFFSSMWAIAAIIGPVFGALFVSTIGWRWIFTVNVPIGFVAIGLIWSYRERALEEDRGHAIDVRGAGLLTVGVVLLLIGLGTGSQTATPIWSLVVMSVVVIAAFVQVERRSANPTVPLGLLRQRVIGPAVLIASLAGTLMFGVTAYVPLWVQSVQGASAYAAGIVLGAMSIGWAIMSTTAGFLMTRVGYERLVVGGSLALLAGSLMLAAGPPSLGVMWTGAATFVIGIGMGTFSAPLLIVIQSNVEWAQRGAATALNQFSRTIGGAVGVALMGVVLQRYVAPIDVPLNAGERLRAGMATDFRILVVLAICVFSAAVAIFLFSRRRRAADVPADAQLPAD